MSRSVAFLLYLALLAVGLAADGAAATNYLTSARGVEARAESGSGAWGTNTALEQYASSEELDRALALVRGLHLPFIRQHFPWREIEPTRGAYDWIKWDRLVQRARAANLRVVAVLDTAPAWAQRDYERDLPNAPPDDFGDYGAFARAFARRYHSDISAYEIWDEPNVHPNWGRRNADPVEYGRLLHLAAAAIRQEDPAARIVLAGLGMNLETQRPHPDYSEILFLRGLYENGFQNDFDIVAAKPYGLWSGPEDRRVSSGVLNFSRVILLRDEMRAHGDAGKEVWAVELGWNALPSGWEGAASPWGSDTEAVQADRLVHALSRVRNEWGWMTGVFPLVLQPAAPANDPRWGFSLTTADVQPRLAYQSLAAWLANPPPPASPAGFPVIPFLMLAAAAGVAGWRAWRLAPRSSIIAVWDALERRFTSLPEWAQVAGVVLVTGAFFAVPATAPSLALLALIALLFALRRDLGLALLVFSIPFFLYPKRFGGAEFSPVEILTLVGAAALLWHLLLTLMRANADRRAALPRWNWLDGGVAALAALGAISVLFAANTGVALREFRVIVAEPALLYLLLRATPLSRPQVERLVHALLLAGAVVCVVGLAQVATGDLIRADGLGRVRAVWGSPNNAALFLGRLFPLELALALFLPPTRARALYGGLAALLAIMVYLTYSRGALFLGLPSSIVVLAAAWLWSRRGERRVPRTALLGAAVLLLAAGAAVLSTARFQSWFQEGTGTGFFRVAVWTSAIHMIRDHLLLGVGLDNFLYEYPRYILPEAWREPNLSHPHNLILDFWVRLGVLGPLVLLGLEVGFFRRTWQAVQRPGSPFYRALAMGLLGSMTDFLAHGMIDAAYFVVDLAFVFMLSLALAAKLTEDGR